MAAGLRASLTTVSAMSEFMQIDSPIEYPQQVGGLRIRGFSTRVVQMFLYEESETRVSIEKV